MGFEDLYPLLQALPSNGLDRSLHAPVLVGLLFLAFFNETLGWTYAGLVVPGYLATVFIVAPVTGVLVVAESVFAYGLAVLAGRWLPRTRAWSTLFGRERFLLIIICALVVRLTIEASVVPALVERLEISHSRELYSIGLVLVPLLANSYWNDGLRTAFPRVAVATVLTYLVVDYVLLNFTNFTVSRFQVANESVSLLFLETPHAYIILVVGAVLGARDNVRYGWDYNGILVPALLAVSLYRPTKLATTVVEALIVLFLAKLVTSRGPLSRLLIVGPRRVVVAYVVGFAVKWVLGYVVLATAPSVEMIDFFGFGYLLPTLLAVKMWNTDRIGSTLMPTLQVAVTSFLVGNGLSIGMRIALPAPSDADRRRVASETNRSVALDLMLADTAPEPAVAAPGWREPTLAQEALAVLTEVVELPPIAGRLTQSFRPELAVQRRKNGWWTITPKSLDPSSDMAGPRFAFRVPAHRAAPWLVVAETDRVADPSIVVAHALAERLDARGTLVRSRLASVRLLDDAFMRQSSAALGVEYVLSVAAAPVDKPRLIAVGALPAGLDVQLLRDLLGEDVVVRWRAAGDRADPLANAVRLRLPRATIERAATNVWNAPDFDHWEASPAREVRSRVEALTEVGAGAYLRPPVEYLRLYGRGILPRYLALRSGGSPSAWDRALASQLGLHLVRLEGGSAWALYEPPGPHRRGAATLLVRGPRSTDGAVYEGGSLMIEVPAPRWEAGVVDAALALFRGTHADALLLSGTMPTVARDGSADVRRPTGIRSYYQQAHETWLTLGGRAVAVQGIAPDRGVDADAIVAFEDPVASPNDGPEWALPLVHTLADSGLSVVAVDGSLALEPFTAQTNPAMAYSQAFGDHQMMVLWLSPDVRSRILAGVREIPTEQRLARLGRELREENVAARALELRRCFESLPGSSTCPPVGAICRSDVIVKLLKRYAATANPYALREALTVPSCHVEVARDSVSDRVWATVMGRSSLTLVPLRLGRMAKGTRLLRDRGELERALAMGLGVIDVRPQQ